MMVQPGYLTTKMQGVLQEEDRGMLLHPFAVRQAVQDIYQMIAEELLDFELFVSSNN